MKYEYHSERDNIPSRPANASNLNQSDPGFESGFSDWSVSRCLPDRFQNNFLVNVSHVAECRENRPVTVREMPIHLLKYANLECWGKYPGEDRHQKLIDSHW